MKMNSAILLGSAAIASLSGISMAQEGASTDMLKSIAMPDRVETAIGTLEFFDGVPKKETIDKVYDNLDRMRAVQVYLDKDRKALDGSKTYKIHLPPNVPAKDFWSFTLYDNQTRSMLQTDERFPGLSSVDPTPPVANADGSYDIYFGPKAPAGKESNWMQTVPGKGYNVIFRLYGPLDPFYDKTWRPGDPELVR